MPRATAPRPLVCEAALVAALVGCSDVPAAPTYFDDVRPILMANCTRCHAAPRQCTPSERRGFRLDHWADVREVRGVAAMTERITVRAADTGTMPPTDALPERAREILRRWQRAGSPRGEPLDNQAPQLSLRSSIPSSEPADQVVRLDYDVADPDGDTVVWEVGWHRAGVEGMLSAPLAGGIGETSIDLGLLATGTYQLFARLRDDDDPIDVNLGAPVSIGDRDAAPMVRLIYPIGGEILTTGGEMEIRWLADDVDTPGPLNAEVVLISVDGGERVLATGLDARTGAYRWSPLDAGSGNYRLELRVSDGMAERRARSSCDFTLTPPS